MMPNTKQVKIDNWGVFFLQRLKHFFNRTDYCDLTLQFQGYAQLKVHRLVLNACTEYFELLEKTCDVLDDCLMMPDDLQVDVIVPIINFMYTGQLEYECHLFDKLYTTAEVMNMSVLTKLLDAQRHEVVGGKTATPAKKDVILMNTQLAKGIMTSTPSTSAHSNSDIKPIKELPRQRLSGRQYRPAQRVVKMEPITTNVIPMVKHITKKIKYEKPKPTRYEVPEEFENENLFETSFADISYESQPLMRSYKREKREPDIKMKSVYDEASCSRKFEELQASSSSFKRLRSESVEDDKANIAQQIEEYDYNQKVKNNFADPAEEDVFDTNEETHDGDSIFNQLNESNPSQNIAVKYTTKNTSSNFDHAKIISEVLKKYPHLVKSNKNIKLKIMPGSSSSKQVPQSIVIEAKKMKAAAAQPMPKVEVVEPEGDWMCLNKNLTQESVAKLVSLGVANTNGPWLCLICGTPGKALNFSTYNKFYRHLADVHLEKIPANICEHCGYKSAKRNHLLYHMYTKHGVLPPPQYNFPQCNQCNYVALTKAYLIKHKLTHVDNREFNCNVCNSFFKNRSLLLNHIQTTGHKISPDRKTTNQCVYCNKIFLREANLYTHLKLAHKELARKDGIIDNSDDEDQSDKYEDSIYEYSNSPQTEHVSLRQEYDGKFQIVSHKKPVLINKKLMTSNILDNVKFDPKYNVMTSSKPQQSIEITTENSLGDDGSEITSNLNLSERIIMFNDNEYVIKSEQDDSEISLHQPVNIAQEAILPDVPAEFYQHSIDVSMPQQTSTTTIMSQRQVKPPYRLAQAEPKSINQQIVVSNSQPYKTILSSAPVMFTTNMSNINSTAGTPKYVQAQASNINLASSSGETIMVLQDGDLNMDQSIPNSGSNIVVVYSHPIGSGDKQYVQMNTQQFGEQYSEEPQIIAQEQSHQVTDEEQMIIPDHIIQQTTATEEWTENSMEQNEAISKENMDEEIIDQQDIPMAENEGVEILMESSNCAEEIAHESVVETDNQSQDVVSNEEEVVEYPENVVQEQSIESSEVQGIEAMDVSHTDTAPDKISSDVTGNQVVEWSDDELPNKQIHQEDVCLVSTLQEGQPEEVEAVEESIENIEKEVQKHMSETLKDDLACDSKSQETCSEESTQEGGEELIPSTEDETEEQVTLGGDSEEALDPNQPSVCDQEVLSEDQVVANEEINEAEEQSLVEESEVDQSIVSEDKDESEDNPETLANKQKSAEKISNLLNDWDDNDSQTETVSEDRQVEETPSTDDASKNNGNDEADDNVPAKVANIENLVNDWEEEEEK